MEPMTGLEPVTSSLPRTRSTAELHRLIKKAPPEPQLHPPFKTPRPYSYKHKPRTNHKQLERETGFEPATYGLGSRDSTTELLPQSDLCDLSGLRR